MKLNIGSRDFEGIYRNDDWLNIDIHPLDKAKRNFQVMDVFHMPLEWADKYEEVHAIHVLEHVNRNLRQQFVEACYRVTMPGGYCFIEVPDFRETVRLLNLAFEQRDYRAQHIWTTSIFGKQRSPGDQHCWGYTSSSLHDLFERAGFKSVEVTTDSSRMISSHHKQEPVILAIGVK